MNSKSIKTHLSLLSLRTGAIALLFSVPCLASIPDGLWVNACNGGVLKTQSIDNNNHSITSEKFYQDRFCKDPSFEFITSSDLNYPTQSGLIDFTYSAIQLVVYIQEVVDDFNQRQVCGLINWRKSSPQTITGMNCALFNITIPTVIPKAGDTKYGIYKIENDLLFYGKLSQENDSSTPIKRPKIFDSIGYKKQNPNE